MSFSVSLPNPQTKALTWVPHVIAASLFIALCAQIKIPLPFTPVPISGQTFAVLLVGCFLGSKRGALSVLVYIAEACFGLPVLSSGTIGLMALVGPTGGYLVGMAIQAFLVGKAFESSLSRGKLFVKLLGICALQLVVGASWLAIFVGATHAIPMGILPFLPGEILKCLLVVYFSVTLL